MAVRCAEAASKVGAPSITVHPQSQTHVAGTTASFSAAATGKAPLSYQWQLNGLNLANSERISGATTSAVTIAGVQAADAGGYRLVVTNSAGSATSAVAVLTVLLPPAVLVQPQDQTNVAGTIASFSATASGSAPLGYQWQLNGVNLADGGRIGGTTTSALTITSVQATDAGSYTLVVSNAAGLVTSAVATLTVHGSPVIIIHPASQSVVAGSSAIFTVTAAGASPLSCQWRKNNVDLADGGNVSGATGLALTLGNTQTNDAGSYQVVVANDFGSVTSTVASLSVTLSSQSTSQSAGTVVLVNSHSAKYLDFLHFIQPCLDNFGFPYTVLDISTNPPGSDIGNCAVIIIGHSQLDTNRTYLTTTAQANLSSAVYNGTGLVNFDNDLSSGSTARYQFVQDIFGFTYGTGASGSSVSLPPTEPSSQMHYITALHAANDSIAFRASITLPGITVPTGGKTLALSGSKPLVAIARYGQGGAVQWGSYAWMPTTVLGPLEGLDDLVWRGVVWAARKPFVMRGLPNLVVLRMDDCSGPFWWVHVANRMGFKPWISFFLNSIDDTEAADLSGLVISNRATASIHSSDCCKTFFYFNHSTETAYSDSVMSNNYATATQWHTSHNVPISKVVGPHYSEIGANAFTGLKNWGVEYVPIEVVPGTVEYTSPGAPWLIGGPYRLYETPQPGQVNWPLWYADALSVPGHPELDGQFFNCYVEVRDDSSCNEWCPANNDVLGSIGRGTRQVKRELDSMAMGQLYTHEWYIIPIPQSSNQTPISSNNWYMILQGITNNLGAYTPNYVTMDYACQYVRATRTSRLVASSYEPLSGQVTAVFTGKTDLATSVYVFGGADSAISSSFGTVPAFTGLATNIVATLSGRPVAPAVVSPPASVTTNAGATVGFSVTAVGTAPLSYQWLRDDAPLVDGGNISGAAASTLTLNGVTGTNAGGYSVVITNEVGNVTSSVAVLTVLVPPAITAGPQSRTNMVGTAATFNATATGTAPLAYQWRFDGVDLAGATGSNLALSNVQATNAGSYSVVVTNAAGSVTSSIATLNVLMFPAVLSPPTGVTTNAGATAVFTVTAAGTAPLSYQWLHDATPVAPGGNVSGATAPTLTLANVLGADAGHYAVVITNLVGGVTSPAAMLTVVLPPRFTSVTLLPDGNPLLSLEAVSNLTYRIDACTDLTSWAVLTNLANPNGTFEFIDAGATGFLRRFYRAVWTP